MVGTYLVYIIKMTHPLFMGFNIGNIKDDLRTIKMFNFKFIQTLILIIFEVVP